MQAANKTSELHSELGLLVDQIVDYAIFLLNPQGEVATWNPGAERIKGYTANEVIGKHFRNFYTAKDQQSGRPEHNLEVAAATGHFADEGWRIRKDGSRFWASVIITAIRDPHGQLLGYGKVTRDLSERKRAEEQLRELSRQLLKAQDDERSRLGRELHDTIGQYLVAVKMALDALSIEERFDETYFRNQIMQCSSTIGRAIQEVRTLSYLLYPPMLEETGLASAIRWHLEGFAQRSGIETTCEIEDDLPRLPKDCELTLFRVFQESLTNVHRHSQSKVVRIRLFIEGDAAILEVKDRGKGMRPASMPFGSNSHDTLGVGIRGMRERVQQLRGKLEINSTPEGTTVTATIPINQAPEIIE